jgi:predicted transcriptional regulator with HTH domain
MAVQVSNGRRNSLKRAVLQVLADLGPQKISDLAILARGKFIGWQGIYSPVARYERWGLVERFHRGGLLYTKITQKGRERLAWLAARK